MSEPVEQTNNTSDQPELEKRKMNRRTKSGVWFTGIYIAAVMVLIAFRWDEFRCLQLNALGDFFAGAFGPLALFWLVLGYFQQGEELRLQVTEMKESVKQQAELSKVARDQYEATTESMRLEEQARSQALMAKFQITARAQSSGPDGYSYAVSITNIGHHADDVIFEYCVNDTRTRLDHRSSFNSIDIFGKELRLTGTETSQSIEISYIDALGKAHRDIFFGEFYEKKDMLPDLIFRISKLN